MKGTGIQTDPYLIETWDDFFDMTNDSSETYYMLVNDLDGNNYNGGVFGYNHAVHTNLDGNGHTIRNLYYMASASSDASYLMRPQSHGGKWENLIIESVQTNIAVFGYTQTGRSFDFKKCEIAAECSVLTYRLSLLMSECTVSLKTSSGMQNSAGSTSFTRCSVNCRVTAPGSNEGMWNFGVYSSRLEMQIDAAPLALGNNRMDATNSILAIKMPDGITETYNVTGDSAGISVLDSTLWGSAPTSGITNIIMLPTESMKNADALNAAGFTVARVS